MRSRESPRAGRVLITWYARALGRLRSKRFESGDTNRSEQRQNARLIGARSSDAGSEREERVARRTLVGAFHSFARIFGFV